MAVSPQLSISEVMTGLEQEVDQLFVDYFRDFSVLDLRSIVSYFHLPCAFITPQEVLTCSTADEVEGFWAPRFKDLKESGIDHTKRSGASTKILNDTTALVSSLATRYTKDGERRGASFTCRKTTDGWKIATVIHHSPDNVIQMS